MVQKYFEYLPYRFSEEEKKELSTQMALNLLQLNEAKDKLKTIQKQINSEIQFFNESIQSKAEKIQSGYEMRNTEVEHKPSHNLGMIDIYRKDTGELVKTRSITEEERQGSLFEWLNKDN